MGKKNVKIIKTVDPRQPKDNQGIKPSEGYVKGGKK